MEIPLYIIAAIVILILLAWSSHCKHRKLVEAKLYNINGLDEIHSLSNQFIPVVNKYFNRNMSDIVSDDDWKFIDGNIKNGKFIQAFQQKNMKWHFVLVCGAFLGEFMRSKYGYTWDKDDLGKYVVTCVNGDLTITSFPFDKIIKHYESGSDKDLYAFVKSLGNPLA